MQIQAGTCSITNGSNRVISSAGVDWSQVTTSSWFSPLGSPTVYQVATTTTPGLSGSGNWELTVVGVITDATNAASNYTIEKDFTANQQLPLFSPGDVQTAQIISRAFALLDTSLGSSVPIKTGSLLLTNGQQTFNITSIPSQSLSGAVAIPNVVTTNTSQAITSSAGFTAAMVGQSITGTGIPLGAVVSTFTDTSHVTISIAATASGTITATVGNYIYRVVLVFENLVDATPTVINDIITQKQATQCTVALNPRPNSANYVARWQVFAS